MKVDFFRHGLGDAEKRRALEVLDSLMLTTGAVVAEFEAKFSAYLGRRHTVGVTSCTAALQLSLLALGVGPGDEVITTPMSFVATANAIVHTGATPVFVDVERATGNLDAAQVEAALTEKTKAIVPVHLYGQMCDMRALAALAQRRSLALVEDAAHAVESSRDGYRSGELSRTACFSFYATKNLTSGEGGAVVTDDEALAERIRRLRLHGLTRTAAARYEKRYEHYDIDECGWKYNMDNLHAALLCSQLERLDANLERREAICRRYEAAFAQLPGVELLSVLAGSKSARHLFTLRAPPGRRDELLWALQDRGIGVAVNFRPIHLMSYYRRRYGHAEGRFPVAEDLGARTLTLPLYPSLRDEEVDYVIDTVRALTAGAAG